MPVSNTLSQRLARKVRELPPPIGLALFCGIGVITMMLSFLAGTNSVLDTGNNKLFGYLYEINWGANFIFIIPIAIYFCIATVNGMSQVMRELASAHMIVRGDGTAAAAAEIMQDWDAYAARAMKFAFVLSGVALAASLVEWWVDCVRPLA